MSCNVGYVWLWFPGLSWWICKISNMFDISPTLYDSVSRLFLYLYLYSAQYLNVLQESKCYKTHSIVQVQSNSQFTDIPLTERQRLKNEHLLKSLTFYNLPFGDRGQPF